MINEAEMAHLISMITMEVRQDIIIKTLIDAKLLSQSDIDDKVALALLTFAENLKEMKARHKEAAKQEKEEKLDRLQKSMLANLPTNKIGKA